MASAETGEDGGAVSGTTGYMSPEQVRGATQDARTDGFAFGFLLCACVTGVRASSDGPLRGERVDPEGEHTAIGWEVHPASFRRLLVRLHREYAPAQLYVTENGAAYDDIVVDDRVDDPARVSFLTRHFDAAAGAVADGVPLRGYFIWTLMDNFEWAHGTSKRFGCIRDEEVFTVMHIQSLTTNSRRDHWHS